MDVEEARGALPEVYAEALRHRAEGHDRAEIATRLGVPPAAMASFLRLAVVKLDRLLR